VIDIPIVGWLFVSDDLMQAPWFGQLSAFVAVNTVLYLTLAIIKTLPKAYLSDHIDRRDRRSESRSIYPEPDAPLT
jgi:hypothetical protein